MRKHANARPRSPWPALAAALVLIAGTGAAPPRQPEEHRTEPVTEALQVIAAPPAHLAFERPAVTTEAAPPPPPPFAGMGLTDFQARYEGHYTVLPGYSTAECMAIFSHYNAEAVLGDTYSAPGAEDLWHAWNAYDQVPATEPARAGDVAVWSGSFGAYLGGGFGHVAIVLADGAGTITTLSQNPNPTAVLELSKSGLLGYLRPHRLNP